MMGELLFDGSLRLICGVLLIVIQVWKEGFKGFILFKENVCEVVIVNELDVYGVSSLKEVVDFINGDFKIDFKMVLICDEFFEQQNIFDIDFFDVKGQ